MAEPTQSDLLDELPCLAWLADSTGGISWCNRFMIQYTGITPPTHWSELTSPDAVSHIVACFAKGAMFDLERQIKRHDGVFRWFLTRAIPLPSGEWIGTSLDIEHRHRNEEQKDALMLRLRQLTEHMDFVADGSAICPVVGKVCPAVEPKAGSDAIP